MTEPLIADLKRDEGVVLTAYPDPLTHADPWTIGVGHTGPEVHKGLVWTQEQAEAALIADVAKHDAALFAAIPWAATLDPVRKDVLRNMAFNMGVKGLLGFVNTLNLVRSGDYANAAANMLKSIWARQVGARANRLADMMRTGAR